VRELQHFAGHRPLDAVDARDAVAAGNDGPDFGHVHADRVVANVVTDDLGDFFGFDLHGIRVRVGRPLGAPYLLTFRC
jgi:hypothetical protein